MFFDRDVEHCACGCAVDIAVIAEHVNPPFLPGEEREHASLYCGEIRHDELMAGFRDKGGADELGECVRYAVIQDAHAFIVPEPDEGAGFRQVGHVVLGEVLQLDDPAGPSAAAVCAVELEHAPCPAVRADSVLHRLVFFDGGFCELLAETEDVCDVPGRGLEEPGNGFLVKGFGIHALAGEPFLHLCHGVRVLKPCLFLQGCRQLCAAEGIEADGVSCHIHVQCNPAVVYLLVDMVFIPYGLRYGETGEFLLDGHFSLHVPFVICLEGLPFFRVMSRQVAGAAAVCFGRRAGATEVADKGFAFFHFLAFQFQHGAGTFKGEGQAHVC